MLNVGCLRTYLSCEICEDLESGWAFLSDLTLADLMCCLDPSSRSGGGLEGLEIEHWLCGFLDKALVLLDDLVEIF